MEAIPLRPQKKVYFASDFHLGIPNAEKSREREKLIIRWLSEIEKDAQIIYLLGDIFDVWFEYKRVVPKGFVRILAKLAQMVEDGIQIEVFTGNHDLWMQDYFVTELDIPVHFSPIEREIGTKKFELGHGDGLGPGDKGYKFLKSVLNAKWAQRLYRLVNPNIGLAIASWFSHRGEKHGEDYREEYTGDENEYLVQYAMSKMDSGIDYFIFGHRHLAIDYHLPNGSRYINTGDWISGQTYAVFDGDECNLLSYTGKEDEILRIDNRIA